MQKAKDLKKKVAADAKKAVEAAEEAYKKAYAAYRKAMRDGLAVRREADKEHREARSALWSYERGIRARPGPSRRPAKPESPELSKVPPLLRKPVQDLLKKGRIKVDERVKSNKESKS
mgnify:CR=1 FL=1